MADLVQAQPATCGELGGDAGRKHGDADGEGTDHPANLHAPFEHEAIEQGQNKNQHCGLRKEG